MRFLGYVLITIGLAMATFVAYSWYRERGRLVSPVPESNGVKVIFITPGAE